MSTTAPTTTRTRSWSDPAPEGSAVLRDARKLWRHMVRFGQRYPLEPKPPAHAGERYFRESAALTVETLVLLKRIGGVS